jgi:uncharacterized protein
MFKETRKNPMFNWNMIGDINIGRPNLGELMYVKIYRLMQFTLRDVLVAEFGPNKADEIFFKAGESAGKEFYINVLQKGLDFNGFIADLQEKLKTTKIGILKIEKADLKNLQFTLTVDEDLDCSGIPICDERICTYDEGFIKGILFEQTGVQFIVKEIDCWGSGDRVCRFTANQLENK